MIFSYLIFLIVLYLRRSGLVPSVAFLWLAFKRLLDFFKLLFNIFELLELMLDWQLLVLLNYLSYFKNACLQIGVAHSGSIAFDVEFKEAREVVVGNLARVLSAIAGKRTGIDLLEQSFGFVNSILKLEVVNQLQLNFW